MSRPPRDALRREILAVAQRLFSTLGFRATSLQMIADEVDCSKAALLYHFTTKAAIFDALVEGLVDDLQRILDALADLPTRQRLPRLLELSVALVVKHREALAMLRGLGDLGEMSPPAARGQELADRVRDVLAAPGASVQQRATAHIFEHGLLGACLGLPDVDDDELADALLGVGARIFDIDPQRLTRVTL
ncbi:MAG TPA: TetR/AcrR family transcriptional regulator [Nocardioidaceae bacterium]|nr:TetR/AcrR family transcriptional regulator [Nocardioidaceae bacterium]